MENLLLCLSLSLVSFILAFRFVRRSPKNLPPSPPFCLPIIGHLHLIKQPVHQSLQKLSEKYGHVFCLRFGSRLVVVVSSPAAAQECLTTNDIILANRPVSKAGRHLTYNHTTFSTSPYGDHWRNLRRISTTEVFSTSRLNMFMETRKDEVKKLLRKLSDVSSNEFSRVEMEPMFLELTFNILMRMVVGKRFYGEDAASVEKTRRFRDIVKHILADIGASNPGDFIPIWNWIDPTGYEKRIMKLAQRSDEFLQGLIDEHRNQKIEGSNTMVDHLLSLQDSQPDYLTDQIIKGFILVILLAGTDTAAVTMEWTLSHLLNNPNVLEEARTELDSVIGQERLVDEFDLSKLSYLQGVISETLRLSPPAPLLVPHYSSQDCSIAGYEVPRDTMVLINAWAIHRDPKIWEDATNFNPKRHENGMIDETYKLIPYGMGRRACPGMGMAQRMVGLSIASLVQYFEWERVNDEFVDMAEGSGLTMPKVQPLEAMCKARPFVKKLLV